MQTITVTVMVPDDVDRLTAFEVISEAARVAASRITSNTVETTTANPGERR